MSYIPYNVQMVTMETRIPRFQLLKLFLRKYGMINSRKRRMNILAESKMKNVNKNNMTNARMILYPPLK